MAAQLKDLSADDMANLAVYFSQQKSAPAVVKDAALAAEGKKLYESGNPATGLPACGSCHGAAGAGSPQFPRVAGQHSEYTVAELKEYAAGRRKNDKRVMQGFAAQLSERQMAAVAQYLAGLP